MKRILSELTTDDIICNLSTILSQPTLYDTSPVLSLKTGFLSERLSYRTLNEEYVVQKLIQDHQQKKKAETAAWSFGIGIFTTVLGLGNGFQIGDLISGAVVGSLAGRVINGIQELDNNQLRELGLEWVNQPTSYLYHQKRHRGHAVRRLIIIDSHPQTGLPCTTFAVQFADGYVAQLGLIPVNSFFAGINIGGQFELTGYGFDTDWVQCRTSVAELPSDTGTMMPIELWHNSRDRFVNVIPYKAPHHSLY